MAAMGKLLGSVLLAAHFFPTIVITTVADHSQIICDHDSYPAGDFHIDCMYDFLGRLAVAYDLQPSTCDFYTSYVCNEDSTAPLYGYIWAASCSDKSFDSESCLRSAAAMVYYGCPNSIGGRAWITNGYYCLIRVKNSPFYANGTATSTNTTL